MQAHEWLPSGQHAGRRVHAVAHAAGAQGDGFPPHCAFHHGCLRFGSRLDRHAESDEGGRNEQRSPPQADHIRGVQQFDRAEGVQRDRRSI